MEIEYRRPCYKHTLGFNILKRSNLGRILNKDCKASDEKKPSDAPGSAWHCRICSLSASKASSQEFMNVLNKQLLDNELLKCVAASEAALRCDT